jgi:hypothetical protein
VSALELVERVAQVPKYAAGFRGRGNRDGDGSQKRVAELKNTAG